MGVLLWIIFGALAGWIASLIMGTNRDQGILLDVIVGIIGAVLGGWVMKKTVEPIAAANAIMGLSLIAVQMTILRKSEEKAKNQTP